MATTNANDLLVAGTYVTTSTSGPGSGFTQRVITYPDGSILERTILGNRLLVTPDEVGGEKDLKRVFYFDLPLRRPEN